MNFYPPGNFFNEHGIHRTHSYPVKLKIEIYRDVSDKQHYLLQVMVFREQKFILAKHPITERQATQSDALDEAVLNVMLHGDPAGPLDEECLTCGELEGVENECPNSKRPCGHHCNCSWVHDHCHWCGKEFGET